MIRGLLLIRKYSEELKATLENCKEHFKSLDYIKDYTPVSVSDAYIIVFEVDSCADGISINKVLDSVTLTSLLKPFNSEDITLMLASDDDSRISSYKSSMETGVFSKFTDFSLDSLSFASTKISQGLEIGFFIKKLRAEVKDTALAEDLVGLSSSFGLKDLSSITIRQFVICIATTLFIAKM